MLEEIRVRDLGVIEDVTLEIPAGMTAVTGETGAGKTLVVEALGLLCGARADPAMVRAGAGAALVEGRFLAGGDEVVIAREIASGGRSRAWVDGRMAAAQALVELGASLVDIYGQHGHQVLRSTGTHRDVLDSFAGTDLSRLSGMKAALREIDERLASLGGDPEAIAKEQAVAGEKLAELDRASLSDPNEYDTLHEEEERLTAIEIYRDAVSEAVALLSDVASDPAGSARPPGGDASVGGALELIGLSRRTLAGLPGFEPVRERLGSLQADMQDLVSELGGRLAAAEDDPDRLGEVRRRIRLLKDIERRYSGDGTLAAAIEEREKLRVRLADLTGAARGARELDSQRAQLCREIGEEERLVGESRRRAAPRLAERVLERLRPLAMEKASIEVDVAPSPTGDPVAILLGANPGEPALPLQKVASGGELSRTMLALRLALSGGTNASGSAERDSDRRGSRRGEGPETMVFDEVDAGIGGEAGMAVGRALFELSRGRQVIVVTHLPQIAAWADRQIAVSKEMAGDRTVAVFEQVEGSRRVQEVARMLSGQPSLEAARRHAEELLAMKRA